MKKQFKIYLIAALTACGSLSASADETITWEILGNTVNSDNKPVYNHRFTIDADSPFEGIAFCMFKRPTFTVDSLDKFVEILPGYFMVTSERFSEVKPGQPVTVELTTNSWFTHKSFFPDGMHLIRDGKAVPATNVRKSTMERAEQWRNKATGADLMIYGPEAFATNDSLRSSWRPQAYSEIPTPKSVSLQTKRVKPGKIAIEEIEDSRHDYWKAEINKKGDIVLQTNSAHPQVIADALERRIENAMDEKGLVPVAVIEDWSDYPYRGLMIDVSRNFQKKADMLKFLDLMNRYGLNTLHFHLGDDEGWRVELPSLPELTAVGSRRGYTLSDDAPFLKGIYSGDGNPDNPDSPANGFYTVDDYIEIIRYADSLGIAVIPEFDSPGHSRAAIRSMEHRARTTGDDSYRLIDRNDSSKYSSAQAYHDNIMNPALPGPYRFWDTVMDDVISIYDRAGVPLKAIHIGGDEVPAKAWDGSEEAQSFMKEKGFTTQRELYAYFVERVAEIAKEKGVKISGWQEMALDHGDEFDSIVAPTFYSVNSWLNASNQGVRMAQSGFPVVLSNVDYLYFDQTPTLHPEEPGLVWGGVVSEFSPLHATVDILCPADSTVQENVVGVSAHLFAETIRNPQMVYRYLLPRILGLAERAHNKHATLTDNQYFGALTAETRRWAAEGKDVYLRQPGIIVDNGMVTMNEPYGFGTIRYSLDGSDPTPSSPAYTAPFALEGAKEIRARLFEGPATSVVSILYLD